MTRRPVPYELHVLAASKSARMARQAGIARERAYEIGDLVHAGDDGEIFQVTGVRDSELTLRRLMVDRQGRPMFGMYDGPAIRRLMTEA